MADTKSLWIHRIALLVGAAFLLGALYFAVQKFLAPLPPPTLPPPRETVTFDPAKDVRSHPLFSSLIGFVLGRVNPDPVGRMVPFVGPDASIEAPEGMRSRLATAEEIGIEGAAAVDAARMPNGNALILIRTTSEGTGAPIFILRSYAGTQATEFTRWEAAEDPGLVPHRIKVDSTGVVHLVSFNGRIGTVRQGESPVWRPESDLTLAGPPTALELDQTDRPWVADGTAVYIGNDGTFTALDLTSFVSSEDRTEIGLGDAEDDLFTLDPFGITSYGENRMAVVTSDGVFRFATGLLGRPEFVNTHAAGAEPLTVDAGGTIWAVRTSDSALLRIGATSTRDFPGANAPQEVRQLPDLFAQVNGTLFSVDYSPSAHILWSTIGDAWFPQVMVASGTLPDDSVRRMAADGRGGVWFILNGGGLVRVTHE